MGKVQLHDKEFETFISNTDMLKAVRNVAGLINSDFQGKRPLFVVVLNGAFRFASDLISMVEVDCEITFVKLASYHGTSSSGTVHELLGIGESVAGRPVIVVEDIVDTGNTIEVVHRLLQQNSAAGIHICTCLYKPDAYEKDIPIDYAAIEIANDFVVGYGLDYNGLGRNLNDLYKIVEH